MSKIIATNRKAYRDFHVIESWECGIELCGGEVKSVRSGRVNLEDSFARVEPEGVMMYHAHISPYAEASYLNVEPARARRLLLHQKQIERIEAQMTQRGLTLVPLKIYFNERGFAKIELGLAKGKKLYDRREDVKKREADLAIRRLMKNRRG